MNPIQLFNKLPKSPWWGLVVAVISPFITKLMSSIPWFSFLRKTIIVPYWLLVAGIIIFLILAYALIQILLKYRQNKTIPNNIVCGEILIEGNKCSYKFNKDSDSSVFKIRCKDCETLLSDDFVGLGSGHPIYVYRCTQCKTIIAPFDVSDRFKFNDEIHKLIERNVYQNYK